MSASHQLVESASDYITTSGVDAAIHSLAHALQSSVCDIRTKQRRPILLLRSSSQLSVTCIDLVHDCPRGFTLRSVAATAAATRALLHKSALPDQQRPSEYPMRFAHCKILAAMGYKHRGNVRGRDSRSSQHGDPGTNLNLKAKRQSRLTAKTMRDAPQISTR